MTARVWSIKANGNAVTDVEVVEVNLTVGQQYILQPLGSSTMTIRGRYPGGYNSPNADLVIGSTVTLYENTTTLVFGGRVIDVSLELGMRYASGTGPADFVLIQVEGLMGVAGRTNVTTTSADDVVSKTFVGTKPPMLVTRWEDAGITVSVPADAKPVQVTNKEWNGLDLFQAIWNTYPFVLREGNAQGSIVYLTSPWGDLAANTVNFSDTANNSTNQVFDRIMLDSLSENYYTAAEITRDATGTVATYEVGAAPYVLYTGSSICATDLENESRAEALANVYSVAEFDIVGVSCLSEAQASWNLWLGNNAYEVLGTRSTVTFRGTTTDVIITGMTVSATPETSRITYSVTPTRYFQWFKLDSATLGVLDSNRLFYTIGN